MAKSSNHITKVLNELLSTEIERFWQIESYGTFKKLDLNLLSPTEQQTLQILENNTILKNGHFETPLLLYYGRVSLKNYPIIELLQRNGFSH